jgi:hypothetical protein
MKRISLSNPVPEGLDFDYLDENMLLFNTMQHISNVQDKYLNHSLIMVSIEEGESTFFVDNMEHRVTKHDLLIVAPGNIIRPGEHSEDINCRIFIVSPKFGGNIIKSTHMNMMQYLVSKPTEIVHLTPEEHESIGLYYKLISNHNHLPNDLIRMESIQRILQALAYTMTGFFYHRGIIGKRERHTAADRIFRDFARLLKIHPDGRSVKFYADKLNIPYAIFLGEDEINSGVAAVKDMKSGEQIKLAPAEAVAHILKGLETLNSGTPIVDKGVK